MGSAGLLLLAAGLISLLLIACAGDSRPGSPSGLPVEPAPTVHDLGKQGFSSNQEEPGAKMSASSALPTAVPNTKGLKSAVAESAVPTAEPTNSDTPNGIVPLTPLAKVRIETGIGETATPVISRPTTKGPEDLEPLWGLSTEEVRGLISTGIRGALQDLREQSQSDSAGIVPIRAERVFWNDSSLGCPKPGVVYTQATTSGVWLVFHSPMGEFDYRVTGDDWLLCVSGVRLEPLEQHPLAGVWSNLEPLPTPRSEVAAAVLGGQIYVFGGRPSASANERYDLETGRWQQRAPLPTGLHHSAAVTVNGKIYLIGGGEVGKTPPVSTLWEYDPDANSWRRLADMSINRGAIAAAVIDGKIHAIGGYAGDQGGWSSTHEVYDPGTDSWSHRAPMPTAREHVAAGVVDGKIYVVGGGTANEEYNPDTDTWRKQAPLPSPRSGAGAAVVNGRIYVFGGEWTGGVLLSDAVRYDPVADSWESLPSMSTGRHGVGVVAVDNRIYVLAGGTGKEIPGSYLNEVLILLNDADQ